MIPLNEMPPLAELKAGEWNRIEPGGRTLCSQGSTYAFYVWPGAADRVAVHFMGGGACWNEDTCRTTPGGFSTYTPTVEDNIGAGEPGGILNMEKPENPVAGWTHVLAPYCTGDIHWGDEDYTYGEGARTITIHHRGAVNARAALSWIYDSLSPARAFVTGCSAGAYGSILWAAHVQQHYPEVDVVHLADSGVGVVTPDFRRANFPHWRPTAAFPTFVPEIDPRSVDVYELELPDAYVAVGRHFPRMRLAQFNYLQDDTQQFFYTVMGGDAGEWSQNMLSHVARIHAGTSNFSSYVADGSDHCILPYDAFYAEGVPGQQSLADWTRKLVGGQDPGDVACEACQVDR
jgi:hypothetical protein